MPYPYNYTKLWEPIQINGMKLRNRISLSPMGTYTPRLDGTDTEEGMRYYEERAKGGVGLIMTGAMFVNKQLAQGSPGIAVWDYHSIPSTTVLTERCHRWGAKVCLQLSGGCGRNGAIDTGATENMFSASDNPNFFDPSIICHALTIEEIKESLKDWAIDADIAVRSGFDAIEVHAHAGYIIDQFMSPIWNRRTDEYGGSFENRARYACEIVQTIRKVVGPKFPILFRISLDHRFNGGRTLQDSVPLLGILEKAGVDAFDVDVASYEHLDLIYPTVYYGDSVTSYVCKEARKHVSVPIINGGSHTMETAVDLLESGDADIIQFGRQLIADPDFPNKLKDNRRDDIRPCLLCNEECIGRIMGRQSQLSCTVNIQACMEGHYQITKLPEPKNVIVIGAGPGGLEAARVAAMRGCKVTLFEKSGKIGGNFGTIASVGFKHRIRDLIWWYNNQLNKLGVDLRLNTEITADDPILGSADAIFLATGSVPLVPPIPGADLPNVMTVLDYHRYGTDGQNIVICGGGLSGCDAAIELHGEGKNVSIIEMQDDIAKDAQFINSITIHELMKEYGIALHTSQRVVGIEPDGVRVVNVDDGTESKIAGDTVLAAFGQKSNTEIADKIYAKYHTKCNYIGDCNQVGKSGKAIRDGFYAAMGLQ